MRCLGRIIALFILPLVITSLPFAIWMVAFWELGTNPERVNQVVNEPVYERLAPLVIPLYANSIKDQQTDQEIDVFVDVINNIDTDAWENLSERYVLPEWLELEAKVNFTNGLSYLNGDTNELSLAVNIDPVRSHLNDDRTLLVDNLMREVERLDECDTDQQNDIDEYFTDSGLTLRLPACKPDADSLALIRMNLDAAVTLILESLPPDGQWVFHEEFAATHDLSEADLKAGAKGSRQEFQMAKNTIGINFLIPLMLMGLIIVFAVRTAKELFFWIGLALMLSGLISVLPVMGLLTSANQPLDVISTRTTDELWLLFGVEFINSLARQISGPIIVSTFTMVFFGFISLVLATMLRPPEEEKQEVFYMPQGGSTPIPVTGMQMGSTPTPFPVGTGTVTPPQVAVPTPPPTPPPAPATSSTPPPVAPDKSSQIKTDISDKLPEPLKPEGFADDRTYIPQNDLMWDEPEDESPPEGDKNEE